MTRSWLLFATALACSPLPPRAHEVAKIDVAKIDVAGFPIEPLVALDGGDGQAVAASGDRIATFGSSRATWWSSGVRRSVALPNVPVAGARWSADGTSLLAGTGTIDVANGTWSTHPAFASLAPPGPPGAGSPVLQATSWSADARYAAALVGWSGPPPSGGTPATHIVVLDLVGGSAPVIIPADGATGVRIAGDRVVVAAPIVRVWTFDGAPIAALPAGRGAPLWLGGGEGGPVFVVDANWSIRILHPSSWSVQATWAGPLRDAVAVPGGGIIGVDLQGKLHAGCLEGDRVREVGTAETGVHAAHLAVTGDGRLVIMGSAAVPVHTTAYRLTCGAGPGR